jgi:hypothetical protein
MAQLSIQEITKARPKWTGPFRIHNVNPDKGYYTLAEMDGSVLQKPVSGNGLKQYNIRDPIDPLEPVQDILKDIDINPVANADPEDNADDGNRIMMPYPKQPRSRIDTIIPADDDEYEVESILSHRQTGPRRGNRILYIIKWTGYD